MAEEKISNKLITAVLGLIIIIAAVVILYVNLPEENDDKDSDDGADEEQDDEEQDDTEEEEPEDQTEDEVYLTVVYENKEINYTLEELESLETITGFGGYRTSKPAIRGQGNYTGVPITTLIDLSASDISNYSLRVYSDEEGEIDNITYTYEMAQGEVDIYNSSNASDETPIQKGGVTMIVCYKNEGEYLDEDDDGKLKIAFISEDEELITYSMLWWKFVYKIEIIEE